NSGHFPSLDVLHSASRVAGAVTTPEQQELARRFRQLLATYDEARDLIEVGAYTAGSDQRIDDAVALRPAMTDFLRQAMHDLQPLAASWQRLAELLGPVGR